MTSLDDLRLQAGQLQAVCDAANAMIDAVTKRPAKSPSQRRGRKLDRDLVATKGARH